MSGMNSEGRELLDQAQQLDPKVETLWLMYGSLAMQAGQQDEAIADAKKEIEFHPDEMQARQMLVQLLVRAKRSSEAVDQLKKLVTAAPDNSAAALELGHLLITLKRYSEIPPILDKPISATPSNLHLQTMKAQALLKGGEKDKGLALAQSLANSTSDPLTLNDLAYYVADNTAEAAGPLEWARKAVNATEQNAAGFSLSHVSTKELATVRSLGAFWDTLGWIYFNRRI